MSVISFKNIYKTFSVSAPGISINLQVCVCVSTYLLVQLVGVLQSLMLYECNYIYYHV